MFSAHTTPEKFDNETITGHFEIVFEENWVREITWWSDKTSRLPFLNSYGLKNVFENLRFSRRISLDSTPNWKNKAAFSYFFN